MGKVFFVFFCLFVFVKIILGGNSFYNCRDWGTRGDGQADDGKIIQEILDQKGPETTIFLPAGNYLFRQPLIISNDNVSLCGESPEKTIIIFQPGKLPAAKRQISAAITARGLMEFNWFSVMPKTFQKENYLETNHSLNFNNGDILEIASDFSETNFRRQNQILGKIRKISGNQIFLNEILSEKFFRGPDCRIRRCLPRKNIHLENFTLRATNPAKNNFSGLQIEIAENIDIKNLQIDGFRKSAIRLQQVYEGRITDCIFTIEQTGKYPRQNCALYLNQTNGVILENNRAENYSSGILLNHFNLDYQFRKNTFVNCRHPVYDREKPDKKITSEW